MINIALIGSFTYKNFCSCQPFHRTIRWQDQHSFSTFVICSFPIVSWKIRVKYGRLSARGHFIFFYTEIFLESILIICIFSIWYKINQQSCLWTNHFEKTIDFLCLTNNLLSHSIEDSIDVYESHVNLKLVQWINETHKRHYQNISIRYKAMVLLYTNREKW